MTKLFIATEFDNMERYSGEETRCKSSAAKYTLSQKSKDKEV